MPRLSQNGANKGVFSAKCGLNVQSPRQGEFAALDLAAGERDLFHLVGQFLDALILCLVDDWRALFATTTHSS